MKASRQRLHLRSLNFDFAFDRGYWSVLEARHRGLKLGPCFLLRLQSLAEYCRFHFPDSNLAHLEFFVCSFGGPASF